MRMADMLMCERKRVYVEQDTIRSVAILQYKSRENANNYFYVEMVNKMVKRLEQNRTSPAIRIPPFEMLQYLLDVEVYNGDLEQHESTDIMLRARIDI